MPKQVPRQLHIVLAVVAVVGQLFLGESLAEVIDVLLDLLTLDTDAVMLGQHCEASTHLRTVKRPTHAQRIQPTLGCNTVLPIQDGPVEWCVVRQRKGVLPVVLVQEVQHLLVRTAEPHRLAIVYLYRRTDNLKA